MKTLLSATAAALLLLPLGLGTGTAEPAHDQVNERYYDAKGRLVAEVGIRSDDHEIGFTRFYKHADDKASNGNGGLASSSNAAMTDCASTKYVTAGWRWTAPYSARADSHASIFNAAGNTWDAATGAAIFGGITSGSGPAGVLDNVNQIAFKSLGASSTIAVTTTWYYRSTGQAVESDGEYNTFYSWSTSGAAGSMDVQNIATHEIGHTFGLDHPRGGGIACLTMYAYANTGETMKRTLGDGDILGIRALYGA